MGLRVYLARAQERVTRVGFRFSAEHFSRDLGANGGVATSGPLFIGSLAPPSTHFAFRLGADSLVPCRHFNAARTSVSGPLRAGNGTVIKPDLEVPPNIAPMGPKQTASAVAVARG